MNSVIMTRDPDTGFSALYVNGKLFWDFDIEDPCMDRPLQSINFSDVLEELLPEVGVSYEYLSARQKCREIHGFDWTDYEGYWPEQLWELKPIVYCNNCGSEAHEGRECHNCDDCVDAGTF